VGRILPTFIGCCTPEWNVFSAANWFCTVRVSQFVGIIPKTEMTMSRFEFSPYTNQRRMIRERTTLHAATGTASAKLIPVVAILIP
jgi:hypothetical protein